MKKNNRMPPSGTTGEAPAPVMLAEYTRYADAQAAVDRLSDEGFPVRHVSIVWSRLRQIEYVTGRRTWLTAARDGVLSGLWFGSFLGLLLSLFVDLEEGASTLGVIVTYALVGAVIGAIFMVVQHLGKRGQRDFSTLGRLDAEAYEVWVNPDHQAEAARILGLGSTRPMDPTPVG